jgi:hypothetical protein
VSPSVAADGIAWGCALNVLPPQPHELLDQRPLDLLVLRPQVPIRSSRTG